MIRAAELFQVTISQHHLLEFVLLICPRLNFVGVFLCFFFTVISLCLLVLCIKTHVRKRKGKPHGSPNGHLLCSSVGQAEEGQYGNCFQLQSLQIFPDSISASVTLPERICMGPRPFGKHQAVDAKQSNHYYGLNCRTHCLSMKLQWDRVRITRGYYVVLSAVAEELKIGIKGYRDGKQDRSNDTQASNPRH